jgi:histidine triad (HIT) family protein
MSDCVFCDIVAGNAPVSVVYQDDIVITIMTIGPVNPGHVMVIPRKHVPYLADMDEETGMHLFRIAMRIERAIWNSGVQCEGTNMFLADHEAAFQEVFHLHLHIIPRFRGDSFTVDGDWSTKSTRQELDEIAVRIRHSYQSFYSY